MATFAGLQDVTFTSILIIFKSRVMVASTPFKSMQLRIDNYVVCFLCNLLEQYRTRTCLDRNLYKTA